MKKYFKITLSALAILSTSLVAPIFLTSCITPTNDSNKSTKLQIHYQTPSNLFENDKNVSQLLNLYFDNNKDLIDNYVFKQNFLLDKKMQQLSYYSIFYNLMISSNQFTGNGEKNRSDANEFFKNTFSSDWFWYLKNVDKLDFQYNIFNKEMKKFPGDKEITEKDLKKFGNLTQSLANNQIQKIYKVKTPTNRGDVFVKDVYYIEYQDNWYIRLYHLFNSNNNNSTKTNAFFVWPDIYKIEFSKNEKNKQGFFKRFERSLNDLKIQAIKDDVEYNRDSESFDEEKIYQNFNDQNTILTHPFEGFYYDLLQNNIKDFNNNSNENVQIWRFTLRGNHEN